MQLQAAYVFVLAALAAASPLVDVRVTAGPAKAGVGAQDICLKICWDQEPTCPDAWVCCPFLHVTHVSDPCPAPNYPMSRMIH
jgi:hypothetical protein